MPSLRSNKNKLAIPTYPPPDTSVCIPVTIPNDPHWVGLFLGALYRLTQQIWYDRDDAHTAKLVAAVWQDIYLETVKKIWSCDGGMFDIRISPDDDCLIQKTTDGVTWVDAFRLDTDCALTKIKRDPVTGDYGWEVEDIGFYRFPDGPYVPNAPIWTPEPRQRDTGEFQAKCDASFAAAKVLQAVYRETWDNFTLWAVRGAFGFAKEVADFVDSIVGTSTPIDTMLDIAENLFLEQSSFSEGGFTDADIDTVKQTLLCNASVVDGRVVFNHAGVISDFGALYATEGDPYGGLNFLLQLYLDESMLNAAGNVNVGTGTCDPCDELEDCESCDPTGYTGFININWDDPSVSGGTLVRSLASTPIGSVDARALNPGETITLNLGSLRCVSWVRVSAHFDTGYSGGNTVTVTARADGHSLGAANSLATKINCDAFSPAFSWQLFPDNKQMQTIQFVQNTSRNDVYFRCFTVFVCEPD